MNKGLFKRLTFLVTIAFLATVGVLGLGIGFYWFNFIVPAIQSGETTRAEMILGKVAEELEQAFEKENPSVVEDTMVRLLLMKDPSTDKNLILGLRVEALDGTRLVKFSGGPVEISGRFAFSAPLYSSATQEVLGEVSFQYNPHFYGELVEDARTKLFWLLGLMAGVIILLHRVLLKMIKPLAQLSVSMREIDFSGTPTLPDSNGMVVSEIGEVVQSMKDLLARLEVSRKKERKTRDQMEQAQAVSHTGSWVWDIKTNALDWSDEIYRIVGMSRGEVEPDYPLFLKLVHPEDREMVESAVARAVAGEEEYDIIHRLVRLDGTIRYIREKSQVTFDENGEAIQMIGTGQDITDQKLAEDLSLRFGRIMDESFNEIYIIDRNTFKFVQINRSAARNMQYTMAEMSEMTPADISPDFSDPKDLEYLFKPLQDGTRDRVIITSRHSRKDGTSYPVEVLLQVSRHESPPKIVAIVQDITERLKAEEAMQEAMQTLEKRVEERTTDLTRAKEEAETYLDIAGSMIVGLNDQGEVTLINKQGCEVLGYSKEEVIGKNWFQNFLPGRDRERVFEVFKKIMFGCFEITERFTNPIVNRSGEERMIEWHNALFRNEQGRIEGVLSSGRDITDSQKAQEALKRSEEKFRKYFELPLVGIAITSPEKGWLEVNDRLCEFFGYPRDELTRMTWAELTHPEDLEADVAEFNKVLEGKSDGYSMEKRFFHRNGEVIFAEISARCVRKPDGMVDYFVALVQDINDRKKAEQGMILAKEEAEQASNAKSEFLSQMSHELRTPLNAILGFGQVLKSDPEEPLTEFQGQGVQEILKAGHHLLELINEILDLSRIESGKLTLSIEDINLNQLSRELMTFCQPMIKKVDLNTVNSISNEDDIYVKADRVRLKQVLLNLLTNAIKYNRPGGSVTLAASLIGNSRVKIDISDTGIGISGENMENLFQPFNRLGSEKTDIEGTGIGLTITKKLLEQMDGAVEVESAIGEGSTFSVLLPLGEPDHSHEEVAMHEHVIEKSKMNTKEQWVVLYVEDNPANLNLVRHILRRRKDVKLLTAPDAKLGIELARAHRPDLILLDINLPGMDGITAMGHLKEMSETRGTPVIAVSANALPKDIQKALNAGFVNYLTKPVDLEEFNLAIVQILENKPVDG